MSDIHLDLSEPALIDAMQGFSVYQRLGFGHLCGLDHFVWMKRSNESSG